jgi:hypothetical protein
MGLDGKHEERIFGGVQRRVSKVGEIISKDEYICAVEMSYESF